MVNVDGDRTGQGAPGPLERVRELLNTFLVPNDTRRPTDRFEGYARAQHLSPAQARTVRQLRDDLRAAVERAPDSETALNGWIRKLRVSTAVRDGRLAFEHPGGPAGDILLAVVQAVTDGTWHRLKACPDCRWVFYDHTRNASKRWCLVNAGGSDGRSCGSIAKVRRYRQSH